jgi:hypothetical protein
MTTKLPATEADSLKASIVVGSGVLLGDWAQVPKGLCLIRMFHERTGKHCLHLQMKLNDGPWYDQPHVPAAYSQEATKESHAEFRKWAEQNLPIFDYKEIVKAHG